MSCLRARRKPSHPTRCFVVGLMVLAGSFSLDVAPAAAQRARQQQRISDQTLSLNPAFQFSQGKQAAVSSPDCKSVADADGYFAGLFTSSIALTRLSGLSATFSFLSYAYSGKLPERNYANVDEILLQKMTDGSFRVFTGGRQIGIFCGFAEPQFVSAEWAMAGIERHALYVDLPLPSELEKLSDAYQGLSYEKVRESMQLRGFRPVTLGMPVTERCSPGIEKLCSRYSEAVCQRGPLDVTFCQFLWSNATGESVEVSAQIGQIASFYIESRVTGLNPAGK
ncbi:hypothetical protein J2X36_003969 [Methylobacterium sp. BE186]|uniref:hypothetical protein n=1 Tax=Methylobacterium sp. BE186 TaxID=2817715 RepID=UPI00285AFF84|nr:hypothetical protein [Methylobacterium sp. BE186]MDR7039196.1 hypothetical protein [Methylobacterium sp. BE186]